MNGNSPTNDHQPPPDIDDEGFDEWAEERLSDVSYDTELGKKMGRDAIRLARGEMSKEAFNEKYHEALLEEFGVDERETLQDDKNAEG